LANVLRGGGGAEKSNISKTGMQIEKTVIDKPKTHWNVGGYTRLFFFCHLTLCFLVLGVAKALFFSLEKYQGGNFTLKLLPENAAYGPIIYYYS